MNESHSPAQSIESSVSIGGDVMGRDKIANTTQATIAATGQAQTSLAAVLRYA